VFVKICGITNREDAEAAVEAGAGALGFIFFAGSPRCVTPEQLEPWIGQLPPQIRKVGVFVDEAPAVIESVCTRLGLNVAQLHGSETPGSHPRTLPVWKAFRIRDANIPQPDYPAEAILLDGPGQGTVFDWSIASQMKRPVILAGGLDETNVRRAIEIASPWGVDVSSAVEAAPGRKDHARMRRFIRSALTVAERCSI
jgi:phosphoribosylanthranilate isomerase